MRAAFRISDAAPAELRLMTRSGAAAPQRVGHDRTLAPAPAASVGFDTYMGHEPTLGVWSSPSVAS
jgi:hypothetical protein